jgi:hypothetical protein
VDTAAHDRAGNAQQACPEHVEGLTDYWANHDIKEGEEYAILTNIIHQEWAEVDVKAHKAMKGLKAQNLRDHMSEAELILTSHLVDVFWQPSGMAMQSLPRWQNCPRARSPRAWMLRA